MSAWWCLKLRVAETAQPAKNVAERTAGRRSRCASTRLGPGTTCDHREGLSVMQRTLMILGALMLSFCAASVAFPEAAAADDCGTSHEGSTPLKAELTLAFLNGSEFIGP